MLLLIRCILLKVRSRLSRFPYRFFSNYKINNDWKASLGRLSIQSFLPREFKDISYIYID